MQSITERNQMQTMDLSHCEHEITPSFHVNSDPVDRDQILLNNITLLNGPLFSRGRYIPPTFVRSIVEDSDHTLDVVKTFNPFARPPKHPLISSSARQHRKEDTRIRDLQTRRWSHVYAPPRYNKTYHSWLIHNISQLVIIRHITFNLLEFYWSWLFQPQFNTLLYYAGRILTWLLLLLILLCREGTMLWESLLQPAVLPVTAEFFFYHRRRTSRPLTNWKVTGTPELFEAFQRREVQWQLLKKRSLQYLQNYKNVWIRDYCIFLSLIRPFSACMNCTCTLFTFLAYSCGECYGTSQYALFYEVRFRNSPLGFYSYMVSVLLLVSVLLYDLVGVRLSLDLQVTRAELNLVRLSISSC